MTKVASIAAHGIQTIRGSAAHCNLQSRFFQNWLQSPGSQRAPVWSLEIKHPLQIKVGIVEEQAVTARTQVQAMWSPWIFVGCPITHLALELVGVWGAGKKPSRGVHHRQVPGRADIGVKALVPVVFSGDRAQCMTQWLGKGGFSQLHGISSAPPLEHHLLSRSARQEHYPIPVKKLEVSQLWRALLKRDGMMQQQTRCPNFDFDLAAHVHAAFETGTSRRGLCPPYCHACL